MTTLEQLNILGSKILVRSFFVFNEAVGSLVSLIYFDIYILALDQETTLIQV